MPAQPRSAMDGIAGMAGMRASHADRERTVDVLKAAYAEGRLTPDEYNDRVEQIYRSQTYGELSGVIQDLPSGPMPVPYLTPAPVIPAVFAPAPGGYPLPGPYAYGRPFDPYSVNPYAPPPRLRRTNGLAVAALVLGLAELPTLGVTALPALICGHIARGQLRDRDEDGDGMAVAGIALGWIAVAIFFVVLFLGVAAGHSTGGGMMPAPAAPAAPAAGGN
ncbi:DUF1707 domain-containing protein [Streptacidiphilus sp. EB103A]|uniref:DUF1707 and DUF4190 domain-containing protein n=1 Tax=Streptacidiphilus sp. EB103A TaxID=3156275 RepID=UPI003515F7A2